MVSELFLKEFVSGIGDFFSVLLTGFFTAFIAPLFLRKLPGCLGCRGGRKRR